MVKNEEITNVLTKTHCKNVFLHLQVKYLQNLCTHLLAHIRNVTMFAISDVDKQIHNAECTSTVNRTSRCITLQVQLHSL